MYFQTTSSNLILLRLLVTWILLKLLIFNLMTILTYHILVYKLSGELLTSSSLHCRGSLVVTRDRLTIKAEVVRLTIFFSSFVVTIS